MAFVAYFLSGFCFVVLLKLEVVQTFSTHSLRYTTEEGLTTKGMCNDFGKKLTLRLYNLFKAQLS